jgi:hypothetical protein
MKFRNDLTYERLLELLEYDHLTGIWTWRKSRGARSSKSVAGNLDRNSKYRRIGIDGVSYLSARLAFLYMTGRWPSFEIDHRDGIDHNDRWANLREATDTQNQANRGCRKDSLLGIKGVKKVYKGGYCARIRLDDNDVGPEFGDLAIDAVIVVHHDNPGFNAIPDQHFVNEICRIEEAGRERILLEILTFL